jgi:hypothetical protein
MKPSSLDFDPDAPVCVGTSFEPELLISFFAFKFRRKSTHKETLNVIVFHYLDPPIGISILTQPVKGIHQPIDGIDVTQVKSFNRVVFDEGNRSNCCLVGSDVKAENPVSHFSYYSHCDAIASYSSNNCATTHVQMSPDALPIQGTDRLTGGKRVVEVARSASKPGPCNPPLTEFSNQPLSPDSQSKNMSHGSPEVHDGWRSIPILAIQRSGLLPVKLSIFPLETTLTGDPY